jgi:hypothetical protein
MPTGHVFLVWRGFTAGIEKDSRPLGAVPVWHAVVFVGMLERRHAGERSLGLRDGMPPSRRLDLTHLPHRLP